MVIQVLTHTAVRVYHERSTGSLDGRRGSRTGRGILAYGAQGGGPAKSRPGHPLYPELTPRSAYARITVSDGGFIELTQKELAQCEDTTAVRCTSAIKIFDVKHPTCMAAIFFNRTPVIDRLCGFCFENTQTMVEMTNVGGG